MSPHRLKRTRSLRSEPDATSWRALHDIRDNIDLALRFVADASFETFVADPMRLFAVTRCLEIISEASRRIDVDVKSRHPDIGWAQMSAAGNIYRHEYEGVRPLYIWRTVKHDLEPLRCIVEAEIGDA